MMWEKKLFLFIAGLLEVSLAIELKIWKFLEIIKYPHGSLMISRPTSGIADWLYANELFVE